MKRFISEDAQSVFEAVLFVVFIAFCVGAVMFVRDEIKASVAAKNNPVIQKCYETENPEVRHCEPLK